MDYKLTCALLENFQVQVSARSHAWIVDEPAELDGDDLGPNPFELMLAALGSCMTITLAHYAAQGNVAVERLWVDVAGRWDEQKAFHIQLTVRVRGDLGEHDMARLANYAERCQVHKIMAKGVDIQTEFRKV